MNTQTTTNTNPKTGKRKYTRRAEKFSKRGTTMGTPVNVKKLMAAFESLEALSPSERGLVIQTYRFQ